MMSPLTADSVALGGDREELPWRGYAFEFVLAAVVESRTRTCHEIDDGPRHQHRPGTDTPPYQPISSGVVLCCSRGRQRAPGHWAICGEVRDRAVRVRPGAPLPLSVRLWGLFYAGHRSAVRGGDGLGFANLRDVKVEHELGIVGCRCDDDAGGVAVPVEGDQQVDANG